jgi:hypothetical protein
MPAFFRFWDAARDRDATTQVRLFDETLRTPYRDVYDGVLRNVNIPLDQLVPQSLAALKSEEESLRRLAARTTMELVTQLKLFRTEFPDFRCSTPVYFLYSVGTFDGATRRVGDQTALIFGLDVVARLREDPLALAVHELFHVHHSNLLPGASDAFYWAMWREGLATLVSRKLNPTLPEAQVCCLPPVEGVRAALSKLIPEAIGLLDSTRREDYARYFLGGATLDIPSRSGYYLGYQVALELAQGRSLAELARLKPGAVRPLLEQTLRRLKSSP